MYPIKGTQKYIQCNLHLYLFEETLVITFNTQHIHFSFLHNMGVSTPQAYLCLFLDVFQEWKNCMRSRMCKNSM
jgi:hypothetical protein